MKKTIPILASAFATLLAGASLSLSASPLVSVGSNLDIFFTGSASARAMSNVFRAENNEDSDVLWVLSPGFEVRYGDGLGTTAQVVGTLRYDILRYSSNSQLNTENLSAGLVTRFNLPRLKGSANLGFSEVQTSSGLRGVRDLIQYESVSAGVDGEYDYSPKFSFGASVQYSDRSYKGVFRDSYADSYSVSVPLDVYYELTPRIDLSLGYRYRYGSVDPRERINFLANPPILVTVPGYTSNAHFFNVGLRGEVLPKLMGQVRVGYEAIRYSTANRDSKGSLALDADLRWQVSPKTGLTFGAGRDFGIGGEGDSVLSTRLSVGAVYEVSPLLSVQGDLRYRYRDYQNSNRSDDVYNIGLRTAYRLNQYWVLSGGYSFENVSASGNAGGAIGSSYDNHIFDISVGLRY